MRPRSGTAVAVLAAASLLVGCGDSDEAASANGPTTVALGPPAPADPTTTLNPVPEEIALAWREDELVDPSRPTGEILDGSGEVVLAAEDVRRIPVWFLYPGAGEGGENAAAAVGRRRGLVVWIHGLGGEAAPGDPVTLALGEAGFVVAIPNQRESSAPVNSIDGLPLLPADVSALLDAIEDPSDGFADDLAPLLEVERVGVGGHSIGASAALAVADHECCRDDRVAAVVAFAPNPDEVFEGTPVPLGATPLLLVIGDADPLVSVDDLEDAAAGAADVEVLALRGADHFEPVFGANGSPEHEQAVEAAVSFFETQLGAD